MTISKYLVAKKENSQLKCISLKLRVLIYIKGVFVLLTHLLSEYFDKTRRIVRWLQPFAEFDLLFIRSFYRKKLNAVFPKRQTVNLKVKHVETI